jgi:Ca2+-transporting ATPase
MSQAVGVRQGRSAPEAAARLARDGANVLPAAPGVPLWRRVIAQLRDPLMLVLLAAAVLTIATGDWPDASVILLVIVVNTSVGVAQKVKADHAIAALTELAAPEGRVLRDGRQCQVPTAEVVVDDMLVLAEDDIVPADAVVVEAAVLLLDEAALTGESVPVDKSAAGGAEEPGDVVSAGTVVVRGRSCGSYRDRSGQRDGQGGGPDGGPVRAHVRTIRRALPSVGPVPQVS